MLTTRQRGVAGRPRRRGGRALQGDHREAARTPRTPTGSSRWSTGAPAGRGWRSRRWRRRSENGVTQSEVRIKLAQYLAESGQPAKAIALAREGRGRRSRRADRARQRVHVVGTQRRRASGPSRACSRSIPTTRSPTRTSASRSCRRRTCKRAEASLRRRVQLDPTLAGAYTALGVVLATTGRKAEAIEAWKRAAASIRTTPTPRST